MVQVLITICFYFGIDKNGEVASNGVFPCSKSVGTNVSIVNYRIIVILKTIILADAFIKLLSNQKTHRNLLHK